MTHLRPIGLQPPESRTSAPPATTAPLPPRVDAPPQRAIGAAPPTGEVPAAGFSPGRDSARKPPEHEYRVSSETVAREISLRYAELLVDAVLDRLPAATPPGADREREPPAHTLPR